MPKALKAKNKASFILKIETVAKIAFQEKKIYFFVALLFYSLNALCLFAVPYVFSKIFTLLLENPVLDQVILASVIPWGVSLLGVFVLTALLILWH